jgi:hypothetical protein
VQLFVRQTVALHCDGVVQALKDEAGGRSGRGFGSFVAWAAMSAHWPRHSRAISVDLSPLPAETGFQEILTIAKQEISGRML